jgi:import inner membrane translocase subunit TIM50
LTPSYSTEKTDIQFSQDLSYLNRPLDKIILLDTNPDHAAAQPENAIIIPKWTGDPKDRDLVNLIPFLEYLTFTETKDIREALKAYEGQHIPTEHAKREAVLRAKLLELRGKDKPKKSSLGGLMASSLGMKPSSPTAALEGQQSLLDAMAEGKTALDLYRETAMLRYKMMEQQIRENGDSWLKEEAEMEKKMQEEATKDMKSRFFGIGGGPTPSSSN